VKADVLKGRKDIPTPFLTTKTHYITTAADPSLDVCNVKAARKMHRFLQEHAGLTDAQAGLLLSNYTPSAGALRPYEAQLFYRKKHGA
jgi:acetamidase/formamidase